MVSGGRFNPVSGSPEGSTLTTSYSNGQRSSFAATSLDRSSSFREGSDSRMTGSGSTISRGDASSYVDFPSMSQCLNLDSMSMGEKFSRLGELKKALNISSIMLMEDGSFGAALHSKPLSPPMLEDLKRFKFSIIESSTRAKDRAKSLVESISKLDKYRHALLSRKRPRNEGPPTERSSGLLSADRSVSGTNSMKMGPQAHQLMGPVDLISPRTDDRTKNMIPNRRIRTALVEVRSEGRTSTLTRPSGLPEKDRELLRTTGGLSIQSEEKSRVLAPGGDSWEKKMKRKRSVGVPVNRPLDGDHDHKRGMQQRASNESRSRTIDSHGFRSGSANSVVGVNKLDGAAQSSGVRPIGRADADSVSLDRRDRLLGSDKEKVTMKGIAKQNVREGNLSGSPAPVAKLKASRAPRTGSSVMFNSAANFARAAGVIEGWEQPSSLNKTQEIGGANNNRKRPLSSRASSPRSSSPPVAKWVGQRPQKISRVARRTNLVPPVPNSGEAQLDAFTSSDSGARLISGDTNGSGPLRRISSASQQFKLKVESIPSPAGFSESEDSGALDKSKEKGKISEAENRATSSVQKAASFVVPPKKKSLMKEETGDGVRRQGRTGRGSALSRSCLPHSREKVGISAIPKHKKLVTDKIESKSGRPPTKKFSDRKASGRPGHVNASLDVTVKLRGEADDDLEELVAAVSFARKASNHACSSSFWHQIEPVFAFIAPDDLTCLQEQKRLAEELENSLCFQYGIHQNRKDISFCETFISSPGHLFEEKHTTQTTEAGQNESAKTGSFVDQSHVVDTGELGTDRWLERIIPLSQRLLAALIVEDEVSEISCAGGTEREVYQYPCDDSPRGACSPTGNGSKDMDRTESEIESIGELKNHMYHSLDNFSSEGSIISNGFKNLEKELPYKEELALDDGAILNSYNSEHHRADRSELSESTISGISSIDFCYQQMPLDDRILLELRSIGLFPEVVPNLSRGEDDDISRDISNLKEGLFQQVKKKKSQLCKLEKAVLQERELQERCLEHLALNKLVEIAYKKLMACRGNNSSNKSGGNKISKQAAQAFVKRTLARCRKFEETGASCFCEHLFKDDLSGPTCSNDTKCIDASKGEHNVKLHPETFTSQNQAKATAILASGPAVNPVEQFGQHINSLKRDLSGAFPPHAHSTDQSSVKDEVWSGWGKKKELLLDDVVSNAAKGASNLGSGLLGGTKGKRSERDHSREGVRNSAPKAGRLTAGTVRGERKTKTKPRQKTAQLSTSVNGLLSRPSEVHDSMLNSVSVSSETAVNGSTKVKEVLPDDSLAAPDPLDSEGAIDLSHLPLPGMEDLGVSDDLDQGLDLGTWLNCPDDVMQDHDQHLVGLSIPMDDLSDVKMIP